MMNSVKGNAVSPELGRLFATYQLIPSFQRSEKHFAFVDTLDGVSELPPPCHPQQKKEDVFNPDLYVDVDRKALSAPTKLLKQPLSTLVNYLTEGYSDDLSKIRAIYRWITAQPVDEIKIDRKEPPQSQTLYQLWRIKYRKGNYAQLVSLLCRFARIPCVIIHGKLKGSTYEVGQDLDDEQHYGEWNAVLIDNSWRFINAYWGTCAEGGADSTSWDVEQGDTGNHNNNDKGRQLFYSCDENYFLTDPEQMISTHLPVIPEWQLLDNPIKQKDFETQAFLKDRYFNLNMKLLTPKQCVVQCQSEVEIRFEIPEDQANNMDFQYLMFKQKPSGQDENRFDQYVFLQRIHKNILQIRVRAPSSDLFRFELVGKDLDVEDNSYDYDWITIYKLNFSSESGGPFPDCSPVGWGPGRVAKQCGMAPMSHFDGEITTKDSGEVEVKFSSISGKDTSNLEVHGVLVQQTESGEGNCADHVLQRIENGDVIFNVSPPKAGEYALKLYAKENAGSEDVNFCNYLLTSKQKGENKPFPRGFQGHIGEKNAFSRLGLLALTQQESYITTDEEELVFEFRNENHTELSINLSGSHIRPEMAKRLITEETDGNITRFKVRFPKSGNYGVRLMGNTGKGHEPLFDYVVKYKRSKKKTPRELKKPVEEAPKPEVKLNQDVPDELRKRIQNAIRMQNESELESSLGELKALGLPTTQKEIDHAQTELTYLKLRREIKDVIVERDMNAIKDIIKKVTDHKMEDRLADEMFAARAMLDRLRKIAKLMHAVLALDQKTIAEIRCYSKPPAAVHRVMMATLLLLGHWDEETEDWSNVVNILGKMGKESLKRKIQEFKLDSVALDVALGARDLIRDFSLDQMRMVSAGAATFYVWVKGITEELEKRNAEIIETIRPRTSNRRRRERTMLTFDG